MTPTYIEVRQAALITMLSANTWVTLYRTSGHHSVDAEYDDARPWGGVVAASRPTSSQSFIAHIAGCILVPPSVP